MIDAPSAAADARAHVLREDAPMGFDVGDPVRRFAPNEAGLWGLGEQGVVIAENVDPDGAYIYDVRWRAGIQRNVRQYELRNVRSMALTEARGRVPTKAAPPQTDPSDSALQAQENIGERVAHLQRRLSSLGYETVDDGRFGPKTAAAVKEFQRAAILVPDGIVGAKTTTALQAAPSPEDMTATGDDDSDGVPDEQETTTETTGRDETVVNRSAGATGEMLYKGLGIGVDEPHAGVSEMQGYLSKAGYPGLEQDGRFGPETEKTVKRFQRKWGLRADGMAGPKTHKALADVVGTTDELDEAIAARQAATGREFVLAFARERALRAMLAEGVNLEEANAGLEALIAKLVANGIPEEQAKGIAAKTLGGKAGPPAGAKRGSETRGKTSKVHRMPDGEFAKSGQGQLLNGGDDAAATKTSPGDDSTASKVEAAVAKHGQPGHTANVPPTPAAAPTGEGNLDLKDSPGRGPTGKLRNFKAMSPAKLKKAIADLVAFGKDDEALQAVKSVAQEKGVSWNDGASPAPKKKLSKPDAQKPSVAAPKPTIKSYDPKSGPSAAEKAANAAIMNGGTSAPVAAGATTDGGKSTSGTAKLPETLSANTSGYSLHELPLGAQFSLADGTAFHTHKMVGNDFMIAKPVGGGSAKPFHKMLAPPNIGPQVGGYDGAAAGSSPGGGGAPAPSEDDLAGKLKQSVKIAKDAKKAGESPSKALKDAKAKDAPAAKKKAAASTTATNAALAAYQAAGGDDPAVIAVLKAAGGGAAAKAA